MRARFLFALFMLAFSFCSTYAQRKFSTGKEPVWISRQTVDYNKSSLDKDAEDGSVDLDFEKQVSLADNSTYIRRSYRVLSEAGVEDNSQVTINFDPSFEQLTIHTISIIRNGEVINKLALSDIKTIQQETDLKRNIYNGTLQAVLVLEDVRKNDVIEYSYTLKGFNPIFQNRYSDFYNMQFSVPYYNIYYKLILPQGRMMHMENSKTSLKPATHSEGDKTVYEWKLADVAPLHLQDGYPDWLDPYPCVMVSEYANWNEVSRWASNLFPRVNAVSGELQKKIQQIKTQCATPEDRTAAALRFVQDDIRYMGLEMGVHSHQPVAPEKTMTRRFGDCKEKSYLLATMLQQLGIEAEPVLINADYTKAISNWLPSPYCFNHTTVRAKLADGYHWFDPTISYQRGSLAQISYPDYKTGLVVSDTSMALAAIPDYEKGEGNIKEVFTVTDMSGRAKLKVTSAYSGSLADNNRSLFNSNSIYEMLKGYQQFYGAYFSKLTADSLTFSDDEKKGLFTTTEYYSIDSFWNINEGKIEQSIEPYVINSIIRKPKQKNRTLPFAISFPAKYHEEVELNLAEDWDLAPVHEDVKTGAFNFTVNTTIHNRKVLLQYDYENLRDHIEPGEAAEYLTKLKAVDDNESYLLTYHNDGKDGDEKTSSYTAKSGGHNPLYTALPLVLIIGGIIWWTQRKQQG